jgi:hypothetical protein
MTTTTRECPACEQQVPITNDICPVCQTHKSASKNAYSIKSTFQSMARMNIAIMPTIAALILIALAHNINTNHTQLIFAVIFALLSVWLLNARSILIRKALAYHWYYRQHSSSLSILITFLPIWSTYLYTLIAPLGLENIYNGVYYGNVGFITLIAIYVFGYTYFLKFLRIL